MMMSINWEEMGTLRQIAWGYDVRTDPLWILVTTAVQGHEGSVEDMEIIMESGNSYGPEQIRALAMQPDRKKTK